MAGYPWDLVPPEPHAGSRAGLRCPGLSFYCTLPQHAPHPLDSTPHPLDPLSLSHMPFLPPHLCPRPGAVAEPAAPGPGIQPAGRTQGAVAHAAAGRAPQGEPQVPQSPGSHKGSPPQGDPGSLSFSFLLLSSTWRGTLCGSTRRTKWPPPSTCHPEPGMLRPA